MDDLVTVALLLAGAAVIWWLVRHSQGRRAEIAEEIRDLVSDRGWTVEGPRRTGAQDVVVTATLDRGVVVVVRKDVNLNDFHTGGATVSFPDLRTRVAIDADGHEGVVLRNHRADRPLKMSLTDDAASTSSLIASIQTAGRLAVELIDQGRVIRVDTSAPR